MKLLHIIDNLSSEPKLYLNGRQRYSNALGGILSIIAYASVLALSIIFFISWLGGSQVNIVFAYLKKNQTKSQMSLYENPFMWNLYGDFGMLDPSYLSITPYYITIKLNTTPSILELETVPCDKVDAFQTTEITSRLILNINSYTCIKKSVDNKNLTADIKEKSISLLGLSLDICRNSTSSDIICKSKEEIRKLLENYEITYNIVMPSIFLNHFNRNSPIKPTIREDNFIINPSMYVKRSTFLKQMVYSDDQAIVLEDPKITLLYDIDSSRSKEEFLKVKNDGSILFHSFAILGEVEDNYKRGYPKLQNVVADIGGVASLLFTIASVIAGYVSDQMLNLYMGNYMFDLSFGLDSPYQKQEFMGVNIGNIAGSVLHSGYDSVNNPNNQNTSDGSKSKANKILNPVNYEGKQSRRDTNKGKSMPNLEKNYEDDLNIQKNDDPLCHARNSSKNQNSLKSKLSAETYIPNKAKYGLVANFANSQGNNNIDFNLANGNTFDKKSKTNLKIVSYNKALSSKLEDSNKNIMENFNNSIGGKNKFPQNYNSNINPNNPVEFINNMKPVKNINSFKYKVNSKLNMRSLTLYDAICSKSFSKNKSDKILVEPCGEAYRLKFSCDHIIKVISEFDNMKKVLLNDDQRMIFKYVKLPSIFEFFENLKLDPKIDYDYEKLDGIYNQMLISEDKVTKSLIKLV